MVTGNGKRMEQLHHTCTYITLWGLDQSSKSTKFCLKNFTFLPFLFPPGGRWAPSLFSSISSSLSTLHVHVLHNYTQCTHCKKYIYKLHVHV